MERKSIIMIRKILEVKEKKPNKFLKRKKWCNEKSKN